MFMYMYTFDLPDGHFFIKNTGYLFIILLENLPDVQDALNKCSVVKPSEL